MGGEVVQFSAVAVRVHSASVDRIAADVDQARSAAGEVSMDVGAYGILCQFLPSLLSPVFVLASEALSSSAEALHETAAHLRSTADQTEGADQAIARRITAAEPSAEPAVRLPL
jgi:hypothetical protein